MADNVTLPVTDPTTIAADDVGGALFQKVKLDLGGDGVSAPVVNALPVSATALPLPEGAATNATLAQVRDRLPATAHAQPLTDAQLRASAVPVSLAGAVEIANDAGNPLPVSGSVAVSNFPSAFGVTGAVEITNDAGNAIPVSLASAPLPTGAATEATTALIAAATVTGWVAFA